MNKLSRTEMKNVKGGSYPIDGGFSMHCRDANTDLIGEVITVDNCDTTNWDTYCNERSGYVYARSNCNKY